MMSEKTTTSPLAILDAKSPANEYLMYLLENKGSVTFQNPTSKRIQQVFEVLDQIIPQLGVFSCVLSLIRAELFDAVYGPPVSQGQAWTFSDPVARVPYFNLIRCMQTEWKEDVERVMSQLHTVKANMDARPSMYLWTHTIHADGQCMKNVALQYVEFIRCSLLQREEEVQALRARNHDLQGQKRTLEATISTLQLEVSNKCKESCELQGQVKVQTQLLETEKQAHIQSTRAKQAQLRAAQDRVHRLEQHSISHRALQSAFQAPLVRNKQNVLSAPGKVPADRTRRSLSSQVHIASYLQTTKHIYEQLLRVQNRVMDDFDVVLEQRSLASGPGSERHPQEKDEEVGMNKTERKNFTGRMAEISAELALLTQQVESLEQQDSHGETPPKVVSSLSQKPPARATESLEMSGNESIEEFFSLALNPDETLLNRYSAMIYFSTDSGKIYTEFPGASLCISCGERSFLCPHKISGTKVTPVPRGCTHLKICRPHAHRTDLAAKMATDGHRGSAGAAAADTPMRRRAVQTRSAVGGQPSQSGWQPNTLTEASLSNLEKHFENGLKLRRDTPRTISGRIVTSCGTHRRSLHALLYTECECMGLCLALAEGLLLALLRQVGGALEVTQVLSVQEVLWDLLTARYVEADISSLALQDVLGSVRTHSAHSKVLRVVGRVLLGEMDAAILLYALLQAESLSTFPLTDTAHFGSFISQMYPFLQESERDSLVLDFTSYSERVVSPSRVLAFILHLILQGREPFIMECEDMLLFYMKSLHGHLTCDELHKAMEKLAPLSTETQTRCLIQQSLLTLRSSFIPLRNAAQIAAFLMERDNARRKEEKTRIRSEKSKESAESRSSKGTDSMGDSEDLQSLCNVLNLVRSELPETVAL